MNELNQPDLMKGVKGAKLYKVKDQYTGEWHEYHILSPETFSDFVSRKIKEVKMKFKPLQRPELVTMAAASSAFVPAIKHETAPNYAQKIPGERPDRSHVIIPLMHSVVDAGVATAVVVFGELALKFYGMLPSVQFMDMLFFTGGFFAVALAVDWYFFGNRSIMSQHVSHDWIEPVSEQQEAIRPTPTAERMQIFARVEDNSGHVRTAGIVPPDGVGGMAIDPQRVLNSCKSFCKSGYDFSQPKSDGLSSSAFGKLRNHWIVLKLIEEAPELGDGRYKLTRHGRAIVRAVNDGDMKVV